MKISYYSIITLLFVIAACKHKPKLLQLGGSSKDTIHTVVPIPNDSVSFNTQILPLITASCAQSGCHDAITREEGLILNSYAGIMSMGTNNLIKFITTTSNKRMPPPPQPKMDTASINTAYKLFLVQFCNGSGINFRFIGIIYEIVLVYFVNTIGII
ncbi:MAG: hypothetical protein ACEQSR_01055 [Candidatus Methylacidiphilales bacterium]